MARTEQPPVSASPARGSAREASLIMLHIERSPHQSLVLGPAGAAGLAGLFRAMQTQGPGSTRHPAAPPSLPPHLPPPPPPPRNYHGASPPPWPPMASPLDAAPSWSH